MSIFLSYKPSLSLWLAPPETHEGAPYNWPPKPLRSLPPDINEKPSRAEIAYAHKLFASPDGKLHVVTPDIDSKARSTLASCRIWPNFQSNLFMKIDEEVYISSPEACYAQMGHALKGSELNEIERAAKLAELAYMLCGTYALSHEFPCLYSTTPLTNVKKLRHNTHALKRQNEKALATQVLDYVLNGSASPQETKAAIVFSFLHKWGGFNNQPSKMNKSISRREAEGNRGPNDYRCDLFWGHKTGVGLEYKGEAFHGSNSQLQNDIARENELSQQRIRIVSMGKAEISSPDRLLNLGILIGKMTGKRLRFKREDGQDRFLTLWRYLYRR